MHVKINAFFCTINFELHFCATLKRRPVIVLSCFWLLSNSNLYILTFSCFSYKRVETPGWRKAPTKLPFGTWKLRFGGWKSFWPTIFGRWKYLSAENLYRLKFVSLVWISPLSIKISSPRIEHFTTHTTEMTQHVLEEICAQAKEGA